MKAPHTEETAMATCRARPLCLGAACLILTSTVCFATSSQRPSTPAGIPHASVKTGGADLPSKSAASKPEADRLESTTPVSVSPADADATPAEVKLTNGVLTVKADNSDLVQILKEVAGASGMVIEGSVASSRVYGVYGPGNPRDVIASLLTGSGYNFVMTGFAQGGAPHELMLSPTSGGPTQPPAPASNTAPVQEPGAPNVDSSQGEAPGPGAIVDGPPLDSQDPQERVQRNLQRLERMHEQQQQETPQ